MRKQWSQVDVVKEYQQKVTDFVVNESGFDIEESDEHWMVSIDADTNAPGTDYTDRNSTGVEDKIRSILKGIPCDVGSLGYDDITIFVATKSQATEVARKLARSGEIKPASSGYKIEFGPHDIQINGPFGPDGDTLEKYDHETEYLGFNVKSSKTQGSDGSVTELLYALRGEIFDSQDELDEYLDEYGDLDLGFYNDLSHLEGVLNYRLTTYNGKIYQIVAKGDKDTGAVLVTGTRFVGWIEGVEPF